MNAPQPANFQDIRMTGAVYTPPAVADAVVSIVKSITQDRRLSILEPSVGDGAFLEAMSSKFRLSEFTLIDIDSDVLDNLERRTAPLDLSLRFLCSDFVDYACTTIGEQKERFDVVVGNPPFIRKHNFSNEFKISLANLSEVCDYPLTDLKNSWTAFVVASTQLLKDDGLIAFVLPYEILTVQYGQVALKNMINWYHRVDVYVSDEKAFPTIEQDAVVVVAQKANTLPKGLYINRVAAMHCLQPSIQAPVDVAAEEAFGLELSGFLLPDGARELLGSLQSRCKTVADFAGSAPGIVTAANDFFIVTAEELKDRGLQKYGHAILKKGSLASNSPIFSRADLEQISKSEACYFLALKREDRQDIAVSSYIEHGEELDLPKRYKLRNRDCWFEVPVVPKEKAFFFKRSHNYPRLCLNEADVYLTDTAYGLRVRSPFTERGLCYSFYNSLTLLFAETNGRFYGGGVLELSPKEFRGLPLVYHEPTDEEFAEFVEAHESADGDIISVLDFGDRWLKDKLQLDDASIATIRTAWSSVRSHRKRHSGRVRAEIQS